MLLGLLLRLLLYGSSFFSCEAAWTCGAGVPNVVKSVLINSIHRRYDNVKSATSPLLHRGSPATTVSRGAEWRERPG